MPAQCAKDVEITPTPRGGGGFAAVFGALAWAALAAADPPPTFDLRNYNGQNYVTSVKSQLGGTCWTHGAMAAIEGNLLLSGVWEAAGEWGEPDLAEYHLDWWNGFNQFNNDDTSPPTGGGLEVHMGGDYLVSAAYLTRGEGAVREEDGQSYQTPPPRLTPEFHRYYVRDIEWYVAGGDLANIDTIKNAVMQHGVVGTALSYNDAFMWGDYCHYQPPGNPDPPNHAVAIIGWNDNKVTQAPWPGAWLCKNSWGAGWGLAGYFWISYYDKCAGQHPEMGAVSFQGVEPLSYDRIYSHDYHGWRDTLAGAAAAFNRFVADGDHVVQAVGFYTAAEDVACTVRIYDRFEGGALLDLRCEQTAVVAHRGYHTFDLPVPQRFQPGDDFYVYVELSVGGHAFDRSSDIPVLLGASGRVWVESAAAAGQSYFWDGGEWQDLTEVNATANFCLKALAVNYVPLRITFPAGLPEFIAPGTCTPVEVEIVSVMENLVAGTPALHFRTGGGEFGTWPLTPLGEGRFRAVLPYVTCGDVPEYYFSAVGDGGAVVVSPAGAPNEVWTATPGELGVVLADDFESDLGWSVQSVNLITGAWERGVPAGDGTRGDPTVDYDGSGSCFVTGRAGGDNDVDGGPTRLISPTLDMSDGRIYQVSYARWFTCNTREDVLTVEVSGNNGITYAPVETVEHGAGWSTRSWNVNDYVTPGAQVRVRFTTSDNPSNSITEAGVDAFVIRALECTLPDGRGDVNCDGSVGFGDINAFVLALSAPESYAAQYPGCPLVNRDINVDGVLDFGDINPFVALLTE